jgi:hypothetical protein
VLDIEANLSIIIIMKQKNVAVQLIESFLPPNTLDWFDLLNVEKKDEVMNLLLEEKNDPPLPESYNNEKIISKGFKNITISDFPIRGRKVLLTFRRRYWKMEGRDKLLKRDIKLRSRSTLLEKEFGAFLKEGC